MRFIEYDFIILYSKSFILEWIVINLASVYLMCYMFALKNSLKHEFLVGLKVNSNSNVSKFEKYIKYRYVL
ncbi:hypothetical protein ABZN45_05605 [Campylobacter sp. MRC_CM3]|uniref:hypothetical protein n=1 Tax=Campylobacter molothri TaxID=1032242 RepID=UPI0035B41750